MRAKTGEEWCSLQANNLDQFVLSARQLDCVLRPLGGSIPKCDDARRFVDHIFIAQESHGRTVSNRADGNGTRCRPVFREAVYALGVSREQDMAFFCAVFYNKCFVSLTAAIDTLNKSNLL